MAVLVTRPEPDNARTAEALRARGYEALLAPALHCEFLTTDLDRLPQVSGVVVTSANALRAVGESTGLPALKSLPLFAVGERTGSLASEMGFTDVRIATGGNVGALIALTGQSAPARLLYIAGDEISHDLAAELEHKKIAVETLIAYRMLPAQNFPAEVIEAMAAGGVEAVLHYSRRSALVFVELARQAPQAMTAQAFLKQALAVPHCCLSPVIAEVLRAAGASQVVAARRPREQDLLETLDRTLARGQK